MPKKKPTSTDTVLMVNTKMARSYGFRVGGTHYRWQPGKPLAVNTDHVDALLATGAWEIVSEVKEKVTGDGD